MKRILLTSFCCMLTGFGLAQNTNPWPSSGNVGIGTGSSASPAHPLEVAGGTTMTSGWNKTMMLTASFPVQIFNSAGIKWGGIGYDYSTSMRFWVNSGNDDLSGNGLLAMTILNNGNIGFGESNPLDKVHIYGSDVGARITGSSRARLNFATQTYSGWQLEVGEANGNQDAGDLGFTETGVAAGRLVLKRGGNVGIGTVSPQAKMHVYNGHILIEDGYALRSGGSTGAQLIGRSGSGVIALGSGNTGDQLVFNANGSEKGRFSSDGNLLIGKNSQSNTIYKIDVAGKVRADEIVVNTTGADFVFDDSYKVLKLEELEGFIKSNKHLPGMAPAKQMQEEGVGVSELQTRLLQKIEELTLYVIEQNKQLKAQQKEIEQLKANQSN